MYRLKTSGFALLLMSNVHSAELLVGPQSSTQTQLHLWEIFKTWPILYLQNK